MKKHNSLGILTKKFKRMKKKKSRNEKNKIKKAIDFYREEFNMEINEEG